MGNQEPEKLNRREVLRKSAAVGGGGVIGVAAVTGVTSAGERFQIYDRVEISNDWTATFSDCCISCKEGCCQSYRFAGDRGTVYGNCDYEPINNEFVLVNWDSFNGDEANVSYVEQSDLDRV